MRQLYRIKNFLTSSRRPQLPNCWIFERPFARLRGMKKGWIALDIDGTITSHKHTVPVEVVSYLRGVEQSGWKMAIATGRSFVFTSMLLAPFDFPYVLILQNGSAALQMPGKKLLYKNYLPPSSIGAVEKIFEGIDGNFLVYSGYERGDFCYFRPDRFSEVHMGYLKHLQTREKEPARPVESFEGIGPCPLIKCFGAKPLMLEVAEKLRQTKLFEVASIRDPFEPEFHLLLLTEASVSKGRALREVMQGIGRGERVISAGDDENDASLLAEADFKIAMPHAPEMLKKMADLIAPPVSRLGVITALERAISHGH